MPAHRLTKQVLVWAEKARGLNWNNKTKGMFHALNIPQYCNISNHIDKVTGLGEINDSLNRENESKWIEVLNKENARSGKGKNKLRTYRMFKNQFNTEKYVECILPRLHRSALAKFRCGTAPIRIETGRYEGVEVDQRICLLCNNGVEDEKHVLLECPFYNEYRKSLFSVFCQHLCGFLCLNKEHQLIHILGCSELNLVRIVAKTCHKILEHRRNLFYN